MAEKSEDDKVSSSINDRETLREKEDCSSKRDEQKEAEKENEDMDHVDDILGAGAGALKHSLLMFGDPNAPTCTDKTLNGSVKDTIKQSDKRDEQKEAEKTDENEDTDHVDDILGAGAGALKHSLLMFGDPNAPTCTDKSITGSAKDTIEQSNKNDDEQKETEKTDEKEDRDHVDDILGAGAGALKHSLLMFGDPNAPVSADDDTAGDDDVIGENDDDSFVHDDEKDVTRHDDNFNIDVRIRLIKSEDEPIVRSLIYDGIYVTAVHRALLNATERPFVMCFIGLMAVLFSWLFGSIVLALLLSVLGIPLCIYLYVRYIALPLYRKRRLPDISVSVYEYWSATDQGRVMWIAEVEAKVVACVAVETHSAVVAEMKHLSVSPEWQCLGIGGQLANHALSHIRRRRFKKVIAHVLTVHSEATNMYNKLGFRKTNERGMFVGFCTVEDFDMNLSTGSQASLNTEE